MKEDSLNETLVNICGFRGGIACSNRLEVSSLIPTICTNVRYAKAIFGHMLVHMLYELMHPDVEVPSFVTEEEGKAVKGLKK